MVRAPDFAAGCRTVLASVLLAYACRAGQVDSLQVLGDAALRRVRCLTVCDLDTAGARGDVDDRMPYVRMFTDLLVGGVSALAGVRAARYGTGGEAPDALVGGRFIELEGGGGRTQCRVELTIVDASSLEALLVVRHSRLSMGADDGLRKDVTATARDILGVLYQYLGQPSPDDSSAAFRCSMISGRTLYYATPLHVAEERVNATIARVELQKRLAGCGCRAKFLPFALDTALLHRYQSTALREYDAERLIADAAEVLAGSGVDYLLLLHSFSSTVGGMDSAAAARWRVTFHLGPGVPGIGFTRGGSDAQGTPNQYSQLACGVLLARLSTRTLLASRVCWVDEDEASEDAVDQLLDCVLELPCEVNPKGKCVRCGQW